MNVSAQPQGGLAIPFDHARLDRLMDAAGIDLLLATSKHNVQYLLGGHRANFFDYMDATGVTRYLPVFVYPKGAPEKAAYVGHRLETFQHQAKPLWTPETMTNANGSVEAMRKAVDYVRKVGLKTKRIATEFGFLPYDASKVLRAAFPDADWVDGLYVMERQRLKKSAAELAMLKHASEAVIESMLATIAKTRAGHDQGRRGRDAAQGRDAARADLRILPDHRRHQHEPRAVRPEMGEGRHHVDRLGRQLSRLYRRRLPHGDPGRAGRRAQRFAGGDRKHPARRLQATRPGALGREIYAAAEPLVMKSKHHNQIEFLAHGMGMVSHEAPRLTDHGPVPYPADDANIPLEVGAVVSVETTLKHPSRGFIKLEDTVVVTDTGHEIYGEGARGWNKAGKAA